MSVDLALAIVGALIAVSICPVVLFDDWRVRRRVDRMNAEAMANYHAACARAKADGTRPPFPPNRWVAR